MTQSTPNLYTGFVPSAAQWNSYFASKQDAINGALGYATLPTQLAKVPIAFSFNGSVAANQIAGLSIGQATSLPANFAGAQAYAAVPPASASVFTVGYIRSGVTTTVGTVTFASGSNLPTYGTSALTNLLAGDWLFIRAPAVVDASLSGASITLLASKV